MNCDPLARWYRWLEYTGFGRALERRRTEFLPRFGRVKKVLMLGEGDGRFLAAFVRQYPSATVDYVDASGKMLALAKAKMSAVANEHPGWTPRVRFHHADVFGWLDSDVSQAFDLVTTHFFLDCFAQENLEALVGAVAQRCTSDARWIVSEFCVPPRGLPALWAQFVVASLYRFFRLVTGLNTRRLPDHHRALLAVGFHLTKRVSARGGLLVSEWWERA